MSSRDSSYPHSRADGFCTALLLGHQLPFAEQSPEVVEAFLAFDPRRGKRCRHCGPRHHRLMLEAISHSDLDAVLKLYRLSPRLLSSIPMFDDTCMVTRSAESVHCLSAPGISCSRHNPRSTLEVRTWHRCPHNRSSLLLDAACQDSNSTILNFVLRNHPDVDQQPDQSGEDQVRPLVKESGTAGADVHHVHKDSPQGTAGAAGESSAFACTAVRSREEENANWLRTSSVNIIDVCIQKNNPEVLWYLLYRKVWLCFMPWNVNVERSYLLSHELSCWYFLHCAALTGSPRLVHLILTSSFGSPCAAASSPTRSLTYTESSEPVWPKSQTGFAPGSKSLVNTCKEHARRIQALNLSTASSFLMHPAAAAFLALECSRATVQAPSSPQRCAPTAIINKDPNELLPVYFPSRLSSNHHLQANVKVSPLHLACWRCDSPSVQELIDHGASVNLLTQNAWDRGPQYHLSGLVFLAIGILNPREDSLEKARALGLVSPCQWSFKQYSDLACQRVVKLLQVLSDAGCDLNATVVIRGQPARALDCFLKPAYFSLETELSERYSLDEAAVPKFFLCLSWEMLKRGAALSPTFLLEFEWNICGLEWLAIRNESLRKRFLHLAVFMGLFPPLGPAFVPSEPSQSPTSSVCQNEVTGSRDDGNSAAAHSRNNREDEQNLLNRQRSCLFRFVLGVLHKSLSVSSLMQVIHFLPLSDLQILASYLKELGGHTRFSERQHEVLKSLHEVVSQPQQRSLKNVCKLVIVRTASWRPALVLQLPVPLPIRRYLLEPCPDPEVDDPHQYWNPWSSQLI